MLLTAKKIFKPAETSPQRFVIVTEGNEITHLAIEPVPSELTITAAEKILPLV